MSRIHAVVTGAAALLSASGLAGATMFDLTAAGSSATINGARFDTSMPQSTGTGVIDPFLRLQANGFEQGYNTSGSPVPFDDKAGTWTHDLPLTSVFGDVIDGVAYVRILLDINESSGASNRLISLDSLQIYTSPVASQVTTDVPSLGTLRYDLDQAGDNWVKLDYSLNSGSGSGDLYVLVPASDFAGAAPTDYMYLYSAFGTHEAADAGFEEWANAGSSLVLVPAPGPLALMALGSALVLRRRR